MILLQIIGGVALTVFGGRFLRKGLDRLFGGSLIRWLGHMTQNPVKAFTAGILAGTVAPSSTALSLITVQMLNVGQLSAERMLAVLLGAAVGITVTIQLIAFHIQDYYALFLVLGVIGFQFLGRELFRGIGQCLLSLGFIFLAMKIIGDGAAQLSAQPETEEVIRLVQSHPWLILTVITILAVVLQSSTACIGLAIGMAAGGIITVPIIIPWILGTNIGICLTSLGAGWATQEGRRLGAANLLVKMGAALPLMIFAGTTEHLFEMLPGLLTREIAMFHTGFNLIAGLVALPFLGPIARAAGFLIAPQSTPAVGDSFSKPASHLDPQALDSPSIALSHATREILRMADEVKAMMDQFWKGACDLNPELARRIQLQDDRIDGFNRNIKNYLSKITEGMSEQEAQWQFTLLSFSNELESVGDILDKNLCDALIKQSAEGVIISPADFTALAELHTKVAARLDVAISLLTTRDALQAKHFLAGKEPLNEWCRDVQKQHYERLRGGDVQTINSSTYFLELLNSFRRINSHISTIAYAFYSPPVAKGRGKRG